MMAFNGYHIIMWFKGKDSRNSPVTEYIWIVNPSAFYRLLLYIALLWACPGVQAQQKQYVFTRLSVKDGLASDYVYSILQDKKGFMWFGTANGLQRYDGKKIISFKPH